MNNVVDCFDAASVMGFSTLLFNLSPHHKKYSCQELCEFIMTPYSYGQYKLYFNESGDANAIVTWAWVSEKTLSNILHDSFYQLAHDEWRDGDILYIMDLVAPFNNLNFVVSDLCKNFLSVDSVFSVRRDNAVNIRKITKWSKRYMSKMANKYQNGTT